MRKPIFVTEPSLPPLGDFIRSLERIWESRKLTNGGEFHASFEQALAEFLGVPYVCLFSNGTTALLAALRALNLIGEVITSPYSFVATSHALVWNGLKPVFADIDPITLNLDPRRIEEAITDKTTAILPTHVYGHPCNVEEIEAIAKKYDLKVIYDAAHCFGVQCHCGSVMNHGDLSVLSLHATKVFHTFEGGAIICKDLSLKKALDQLKNFGFTSEVSIECIGINGKMSELNAAFGLLLLNDIEHEITRRRSAAHTYDESLAGVQGIRLHQPNAQRKSNYGYYPIFIDEAYPLTRDGLYVKMKAHGVNARRYFYPLITDMTAYQNEKVANHKVLFPNAKRAADQVLCLPIYPRLSQAEQNLVIDIIRGG